MQIVDGKMLPTVTKTAIKGFFSEYRFLSNFHVCDVRVCGKTYSSSEHAYMALKTTNESQRKQIRLSATPRLAKKLGRFVTLRPGWDDLRLIAMRKVVLAKFEQNKDLRQKLLDTGTKFLEETNNWGDVFWGVSVETGEGLNNLGQVLMSVRSELTL